jgi:hypothetical protein
MANALDRGAGKGRAIGASEALTRREVIRSYTYGGAYAMGQESWRGALQPGMAADFIALDKDPFEADVDLRSVGVLMTVVRGAVHHDAIASSSPGLAGATP